MSDVANPVGNALGQLIPPLIGTTRDSVRAMPNHTAFFMLTVVQIFAMAIIFTVAAPIVFLVGEAPPTPPSPFHLHLVSCAASEY